MESAEGKPGAARPDKQRGVGGLQRAGLSEERISALLQDDLLDFIFCAGARTGDRAVSEYLCVSLLATLHVCCSFSLPALLFFSCVSDLVKCSRTAAWRMLLQLIN